LGMRLVTTLANQLSGTVDMDNSSGTTFKILFSELRTLKPQTSIQRT